MSYFLTPFIRGSCHPSCQKGQCQSCNGLFPFNFFRMPKSVCNVWLSHETTIQRGCGFKWFCGAVTGWFGVDFCHLRITHPETNIATENRPLEKDIPDLETTIFRCKLLGSGRVFFPQEMGCVVVFLRFPTQVPKAQIA